MDMRMNKTLMELWNGWHGNTQNSLIHQPFTLLFNPLQSLFHSIPPNTLTSCLLFIIKAIVDDWSVKRKKVKEVCDWRKKAYVDHVLFGKDSEATDGGWMAIRKVHMWWAWICGTWTDTPERGCFCVNEVWAFLSRACHHGHTHTKHSQCHFTFPLL